MKDLWPGPSLKMELTRGIHQREKQGAKAEAGVSRSMTAKSKGWKRVLSDALSQNGDSRRKSPVTEESLLKGDIESQRQ